MMMIKNKNIKLDWEVLEKHWQDAYEADYGHLFFNNSFERTNINLPLTTARVETQARCFETS